MQKYLCAEADKDEARLDTCTFSSSQPAIMIVTFYGVRGSAATPGPLTVKYGGNTSCVHIKLENGNDLIIKKKEDRCETPGQPEGNREEGEKCSCFH